MPRDSDDYEEGDYADYDYADLDQDDWDSGDYEHAWGGPEDEELEDWEERQAEDEDDEFEPADYASLSHPLPAPQPGDEAGARQHFAALKHKYKADSCRDTSPLNLLYKILLKLESGEWPDQREADWLRENRLYGPLRVIATRAAQFYEEQFSSSRDGWDAVKASKYWRTVGQPTKALAVTEGLAECAGNDFKLRSAVETTRGGAFRDQGNLEAAEVCGLRAVQLSPKSFHPRMLLGAVYYQKGDPQKGDEYFAVAIQLGAKPRDQERQIKSAVRQAGEAERRVVAQYLLQKDPVKYGWANRYLG